MSIQKTVIGIILFSVCFHSCKKDSRDNQFDSSIQVKLSIDGLAYVKLGLGKYFIYRDSANRTLDSVVVTKSWVENTFTPAGSWVFGTYAAYNAEVFSLTLTKFEAGIQTLWGIDFRGLTAICCPSVSTDNEPVEI